MEKRYGISVIGFAIAVFIMIGITAILVAPSFVDENNSSPKKKSTQESFEENVISEVRNIENNINSRIDILEHKISETKEEINQNNTVKNKYVCVIEGGVNSSGDIIPTNQARDSKKFIFSCEYKE